MKRLRFILPALLMAIMVGGCGRAAGVIFPPLEKPVVWPAPPETSRIRYVGQLATSADLKPGRSSLQVIGETIFGKDDIRSMLTPFAVCTDGADRVFVADSNAQLVHVFNLKTRVYEQWKPGDKNPPFAQPVGIAWDPSGKLIVADSVAGVLYTFDSDGKFLSTLGGGLLKRPCGIAVHAPTGRIYVADAIAHQVVVLSSSGAELLRLGRRGTALGEFNFPINIALDKQGRLYVADALNFRVQQFSPDMKPVRQIGRKGDLPGYFAQPKCLATDSDNHLYVVDNQFEAVQIFDPEGHLLMDFGEEGRGPGEFWLPTGLCIDAANRLWIADSYNRRLQVFDYLPQSKEGQQ